MHAMAPKCQPQQDVPSQEPTKASGKINQATNENEDNNNNNNNNNNADSSCRNGRPPLPENNGDKSWWTWMEQNLGSDELGMISPHMLCNRSSSAKSEPQKEMMPSFDYAAMHAMLIEALLEEQKPMENSSIAEYDADVLSAETDPFPTKSTISNMRSNLSDSSTGSFFNIKRKLKKNKRKRERSKEMESASVLISLPPADSVGNLSTFSSVESSLSQSSTSSFCPSPASFLSPNCRLQKDRGNGCEPGTAITCHGKEAALEKFRAKTAILGQTVKRDDKTYTNDSDTETSIKHRWGVLKPSAKAEMRRGPVKLTKLDPPETRSILEARMGFLSLKYGILLQWDKTDGLVELIVMRKMVTGAFMDVEAIHVGNFNRKLIHSHSNPTRKSSQGEQYRFPPTRSLPQIPPTPSDYDGDDSIQTPGTNTIESGNLSEVNEIEISEMSLSDDKQVQPKKLLYSNEKPPLMNGNESYGIPFASEDQIDEEPTDSNNTSYTIRNIIPGSNGSNAIVEKTDKYEAVNNENSTEPVLMEPYLVSRPKYFSPSTLTVTVLRARGLMRKRKQVNTYVRLSTKNASHRTGVIKMSKNPVWRDKDHNKCTLSVDESVDDALKVEICDRRHLLRDRVLSVLYVPLDLVEPHKNGGLPPTEVTIPCRMLDKTGPYGSITLALSFKSHRRYWMREEIRARENKKDGKTHGDIEVTDAEDDSWTMLWFCCY